MGEQEFMQVYRQSKDQFYEEEIPIRLSRIVKDEEYH